MFSCSASTVCSALLQLKQQSLEQTVVPTNIVRIHSRMLYTPSPGQRARWLPKTTKTSKMFIFSLVIFFSSTVGEK